MRLVLYRITGQLYTLRAVNVEAKRQAAFALNDSRSFRVNTTAVSAKPGSRLKKRCT